MDALPDAVAAQLQDAKAKLEAGDLAGASVPVREALVAVGLPSHAERMPDADELTPAQRCVVETLARWPKVYVAGVAVPPNAWALQRWLGQLPSGVLERPIEWTDGGTSRTDPLWRVLRAQMNRIPAVLDGLKLPLRERLEVLADLSWGMYGLRTGGWRWGDPRQIGDDLGEWATTVADRLTVERWRSADPELGWPVFVALARAKVPIEPRWDGLLVADGGDRRRVMVECANAIPADRRDEAVAAAVARLGMPIDIVRAGLALLHTFPSRALLRVVQDNADHAASGPEHARLPKAQIEKQLAAVAKRHPVVATALRAPRPSRRLAVVEQVRPTSVDALDEIARAQLSEAGRRYDGEPRPAADRLDAGADAEDHSFAGSVSRVRCVDETERQEFDLWLYRGDSGTMFAAGTLDVVVEVIQADAESPDPALRDGLRELLHQLSW